MYLLTSILLAALPFLVSTRATLNASLTAVLVPRTDETKAYTLQATNMANTDVDGQPIVAYKSNFYIGQLTDTGPRFDQGCLTGPSPCHLGSEVIVVNSQMALNNAAPGGQSIYITKTGVLAYTAPYSNSIPSGAMRTGFDDNSVIELPQLEFPSPHPYWFGCPVNLNGTQCLRIQLAPLNDTDLSANCSGFGIVLTNQKNAKDNAFQAIKNYTRPH